jgi:tetratricopeptide (TPR) repeat protein
MGRIKELPDDFDSSLKLDSTPFAPPPELPFSTKSRKNGVKDDETIDRGGPAMPPHMASVKNMTADEVITEMNRTPLFMTTLDETDGEGGENIQLEAMRALAYEGTPAEVAGNFREQGNDCYKTKQWKDAKEFYIKGILVLKDATIKRSKGEKIEGIEEAHDADEAQKERGIEEFLYSNRAAANLSLQNYRQTTQDSIHVIQLNPMNLKAHYRLATAQLALSNLFNANTALNAALALFPNDTSLIALQKGLALRSEEVQRIEVARQEREARKLLEGRTLLAALKARNIRIRKTSKPPDMEDALIHLEPDSISPSSVVHFPVLILYPIASQSDLIKSFAETSTLAEHLDYIVQDLPWDQHGAYKSVKDLQCFMDTIPRGLIKVGKKVPLSQVLGGDKVELVDGIVRIMVVPSKEVGPWIEEMKQKKG